MNEMCMCGHVEDEHYGSGACSIDGCLCGGFDEDEDADE